MQFEQAKGFIINKLTQELPAQLHYHSIAHVMDVYQSAENIGRLEGITENEMLLLLTAVLFHDAGFISIMKGHEEQSCAIAEQYLPHFGYSPNELTMIKGLIMATQIPQSPKNHLEEIICDADLDYLGRDDFFTTGRQLYDELCAAGLLHNEDEWNKLQVNFISSHHYFTATAIKLRQEKKEEHLRLVKLQLKN